MQPEVIVQHFALPSLRTSYNALVSDDGCIVAGS